MKFLKFCLLFSISIFILSCSDDSTSPTTSDPDTVLDKAEAQLAFSYLNQVRLNPAAYSEEIKNDLSYVSSQPVLVWNSTLAKVAENKAKDMAGKNYLSHIDSNGNGINFLINQAGYKLAAEFLTTKDQSDFESIAAGNDSTGKEFIKLLILDNGLSTNDKVNRIRLLSIDPSMQDRLDIGIGIARNPKSYYKNYISVIIAKKSN